MALHGEEGMNATEQREPRRLHFGHILLISFVVYSLGYIIDQTVRWTDHLRGFMNGVLQSTVPFGFQWCILVLPWSVMIFALYRWRKWRRFRTHLVLAPAVVWLIVSIGSLIVYPPTPSNRFKQFVKIDLPKNIQNLRYDFTGGGLADYRDSYYFQTTPEETDRLITEMKLAPAGPFARDGTDGPSDWAVEIPPGFSDITQWQGAVLYRRTDDLTGWYYSLITDSNKTRVYIEVSCL